MKDMGGGIQGDGLYAKVQVGYSPKKDQIKLGDKNGQVKEGLENLDTNDDGRISVSETLAHQGSQDGIETGICKGMDPKFKPTDSRFSGLLDEAAKAINKKMNATGEMATFRNLKNVASSGNTTGTFGATQNVKGRPMSFDNFRAYMQGLVDKSGLAADDKAAIMAQVERTIAKKSGEKIDGKPLTGLWVQTEFPQQISIVPPPKPPAPTTK